VVHKCSWNRKKRKKEMHLVVQRSEECIFLLKAFEKNNFLLEEVRKQLLARRSEK